ncbi:MAG: DUF6088 family protein [Bacteroidales bacterium]|nr:DUF6088 family protein [Bacteroidales bacterium]
MLTKIKKAKGGTLFFVEGFLRFGNAKAIAKALERLVQKGEITRVARSMYARLETDPVIGPVMPGLESIARAVARRDKARIVPTGAMAMHLLGLSTQIPMNIVYLTDGAARKLMIGRGSIVFKKSAPRNLATIGKISTLVIQALKTIRKDKVSLEQKEMIIRQLQNEEKSRLEHDIRLAPEWIRKIMREAITQRTK